MFRERGFTPDPLFTRHAGAGSGRCRTLAMAGPKRPQDRVPLADAAPAFERALTEIRGVNASDAASDMDEEGGGSVPALDKRYAVVKGEDFTISSDGHVVIAAITSCTNTSNPSVLIGAGPARPQCPPARGLTDQAVGQDVAGAGFAGGHRLSGKIQPAGRISTSPRLRPGRLSAAPPVSAIPGRCRKPISDDHQ